MSRESFIQAYQEAAFWSSTDDHGNPMGGIEADPSAECTARLEKDAGEFYDRYFELFENDEQAGHDFWLTRNHHGAGFWDRGLGARGDYLTEVSHGYGSCDLIIGDDGQIHVI